jgi:hypothetical protein
MTDNVEMQLRSAAPSLRSNLPDAITVRERIRKGTGPNDGLPFIVIVRVPDITAYAAEPSTFQKPIL